MKKICLVSTRSDLTEIIKNKFDGVTVSDKFPVDADYNLIVLTDYFSEIEAEGKNIIRSHLSLLPVFNTSTPVKDAYLSGVKVTGVTVHRVENNDLTGLILAQYPVIIDSYTNYSQLEEELYSLENELLPLVIKSVLDDKVFDITELIASGHKCGGCGNCGKCN